MNNRLPPEVTLGGGDGREPSWHDKLDGDAHGYHFLFGVNNASLRLKPTKRGVDVFLRCRLEQLHVTNHFSPTVNTMRGWRAIQAGRELSHYNYPPVPTDDEGEYFALSLAPGDYMIENTSDGKMQLYWRDHVGTANRGEPHHAPEVVAYYEQHNTTFRRKRTKLELPPVVGENNQQSTQRRQRAIQPAPVQQQRAIRPPPRPRLNLPP